MPTLEHEIQCPWPSGGPPVDPSVVFFERFVITLIVLEGIMWGVGVDTARGSHGHLQKYDSQEQQYRKRH